MGRFRKANSQTAALEDRDEFVILAAFRQAGGVTSILDCCKLAQLPLTADNFGVLHI